MLHGDDDDDDVCYMVMMMGCMEEQYHVYAIHGVVLSIDCGHVGMYISMHMLIVCG